MYELHKATFNKAELSTTHRSQNKLEPDSCFSSGFTLSYAPARYITVLSLIPSNLDTEQSHQEMC